MPDGSAFMNEDNGYSFSEKDCGLTLLPNSEGEYEQDVVFIKEGSENQVFTATQLETLESDPVKTLLYYGIPEVELEAARGYLDGFIPEHALEECNQLTYTNDQDSFTP